MILQAKKEQLLFKPKFSPGFISVLLVINRAAINENSAQYVKFQTRLISGNIYYTKSNKTWTS